MRRLCIGLLAAVAIAPALSAATVDGIPIHYSIDLFADAGEAVRAEVGVSDSIARPELVIRTIIRAPLP